jgi:multiple sugar transport system substrate-binding protein
MKRRGKLLIVLWFAIAVIAAWQFSNIGDLLWPENCVLKLICFNGSFDRNYLTDIVDEFQKIHPGIKVKLVRVPYNEYKTQLKNHFKGKVVPDIIYVSNLGEFNCGNLLTPLDDYVNADTQFPIKDFYPSVIEHFTTLKNLYAVPINIRILGFLFYNKNMFDEAKLTYPNENWNWDDLLVAAQALTKYVKTPLWERDYIKPYGFADDGDCLIEPWVYSSGGRWVDDPLNPSRWTFNTPEFIRGIQFRADLMNKNVMFNKAKVATVEGVGDSDIFVNGGAAMFLSGNWTVQEFRKINKFDWDVALFPKGPKGLRGIEITSDGYGIMNTCKHKKAAWELVSFLTGRDAEEKMVKSGGYLPVLQSLADSSAVLDDQKPLNKKILLNAISDGIFPPMMSDWDDFKDKLAEPIFSKVWRGELTAAEAVSQLYDQVKDKPFNP